jgi:FlaA1/EpsC-like NDP-sugar epimerase
LKIIFYVLDLKQIKSLLVQLNRHIANYVLDLPRPAKRLFVMAVDTGLCLLSVWLSFYLRLGEFMPMSSFLTSPLLITIIVSVVLALPIFVRFGLYRAIFRYGGISAMMSIVKGMVIYTLLFSTIFTFFGKQSVPRTIGLIQPILLFGLVSASRIIARVWLSGLYISKLKRSSLPQVLIYGAGRAGRQLASALANSHSMNVAGFLEDDFRLHGQLLNGLLIFDPKDLEEIVNQRAITDILLVLPSVSRDRRNQILAQLANLKISVRTLPDLSDIVSGKVTFTDIRQLDIDDLLGRDPVKPIELLLNRNTFNKTVLVTGAGGSIGSELCKQLLSSKPKRLLLVDMNEFALYQIHQEIQNVISFNKGSPREVIEVIPLLASVCNEQRMNEIMDTWKPQTVYHAAAYKHVPLVEHNPAEGVHNNVWGTKVCAEAAVQNGVQNFVLISTDKAVRPTNIMGTSKRLSEMILQAINEKNTSTNLLEFNNGSASNRDGTCFSIVRFGNVLGSSGSVVPLFREQIKNGQAITITHTEVTRYFMTIPEAAQLVIQAGAMGAGGDVFVLDMGQPVRIYDLASSIVKLSGLTLKDESNPQGDIEIKVTGLRPGEKLYEELLTGDNPQPTQHPRILKAQERFIPWDRLQGLLHSLNLALSVNDVAEIRELLQKVVTGYQPSDEVVDWVYLERERQRQMTNGS